MCELRCKLTWDHTCSIVASIYNSRQGVKSKDWIDPVRLNPFREKPKRQGGKMRIEQFAKAFGK